MLDISDLHNTLNITYDNWMRDIKAANDSANHIADGVEELRLLFEGHEVCVYNMQRMFLVLLSTKKAWRGSIEGIGHKLKQGLGQLSNQLSRSEQDYNCSMNPTQTHHLSTDMI